MYKYICMYTHRNPSIVRFALTLASRIRWGLETVHYEVTIEIIETSTAATVIIRQYRRWLTIVVEYALYILDNDEVDEIIRDRL